MEFKFLANGMRRTIALEKKGGVFIVRAGAAVFEADICRISDEELQIHVGGRSLPVYVVHDGQHRIIAAEGRVFTISEPSREGERFLRPDEKSQDAISYIKAPMPGKVIKINVSEGEEVRTNQSLVILEAMKMENEINSAAAGIVKKIHVLAGDLVDAEKTLIEIEPKR